MKITPDEQVKVLDFGLAKVMEPSGVASDASPTAAGLTHSPTLSVMATQAGMILGTAAYMSPEQAKGLSADHRSDVFSLGVVLYEMLTGRQPFQGETAPDILAAVLVREADLTALPPNLNPRLYELLRRCLDKNPKKRWQAMGDLRAEIEDDRGGTAKPADVCARGRSASTVLEARGPLCRHRVACGRARRRRSVEPQAFNVSCAASGHAISDDARGRAGVSGPTDRSGRVTRRWAPSCTWPTASCTSARWRTWRRDPSRVLQDNQGLTTPVFSPDGRSIAFYEGAAGRPGTLKSIAVSGGAVVTICAAE